VAEQRDEARLVEGVALDDVAAPAPEVEGARALVGREDIVAHVVAVREINRRAHEYDRYAGDEAQLHLVDLRVGRRGGEGLAGDGVDEDDGIRVVPLAGGGHGAGKGASERQATRDERERGGDESNRHGSCPRSGESA